MKQTLKNNKEKPLSERPEWFDTYLHLKYKLTQKVPGRFASLGLMKMEDISSEMTKGMWDLSRIKAAVVVLVKDGLIDLVYKTEDGKLWTEDFSLPENKRTLDRLISGELFNKKTGKKYDLTSLERFYAVPQKVLARIPEEVLSSSSASILTRIRNWISNG